MSDFILSSRLVRAPASKAASPRVSTLAVAAVVLPLLMVASAFVTPAPDMSAAEIYTLAE